MKKIAFIISAALLLSATAAGRARISLEPAGTYLYAQKDSVSLFLDVYEPAEGSGTVLDGITKPTVLFVFGGGFKTGKRDDAFYLPWYKKLTDNGFRVVAIDYRLALKNSTKVGLAQADEIYRAVETAVEDLKSATAFILDNAAELGIDPSSIVVGGSSAGAMTALQAEWEICNGNRGVLPEGFNYAGVMAFSGAIFSREGAIRFRNEPAPILLFHGTDDKIVTYNQIWFFKQRFAGTSAITRVLSSEGRVYNTYRFKGKGHEVSASMMQNWDEEIRFIETDVMKKERRIIDSTVEDPSIKPFAFKTLKDIYN